MSVNLFAVSSSDVNRTPLAGVTVTVTDPGSMSTTPLNPVLTETLPSGRTYWVFDMSSLTAVDVAIAHPQFVPRKARITRDPTTGNLSSDTRSSSYGLFTPSSAITNSILPTVEFILLRVAVAPVRSLSTNPPPGTAGQVLDDPKGIWGDQNGRFVGLVDSAISGYPVVLDPTISGDPSRDDWGRFKATTKSIDPQAPTAGTWFRWLEYGDVQGTKWLIAAWTIGGAGAKPSPNAVDVVVLYSPNTAFALFAPKDLYPYKRKYQRNEKTGAAVLTQPYTELAYRYLSTGGTSPKFGRDFGFAYQGIAAERSFVLILPIQMYGDSGPLLAQDGLARLASEVVTFVGDNTVNTVPPTSSFGNDQSPRLGRLGIAGYSVGMNDVRKLLATPTYRGLADQYAALASTVTGDQRAAYSEAARRLRALPEALWASPSSLVDKGCKELYSIDGFFNGENKKFQDEMALWFSRTDDAMLRIYATDGRFSEAEIVSGTKLDDVFRGVTPIGVGVAPDPIRSKELHRADGRASFVWFTEKYMSFTGVDFMPDIANPGIDAHHTVPRIVFSHAISQSRLARQ